MPPNSRCHAFPEHCVVFAGFTTDDSDCDLIESMGSPRADERAARTCQACLLVGRELFLGIACQALTLAPPNARADPRRTSVRQHWNAPANLVSTVTSTVLAHLNLGGQGGSRAMTTLRKWMRAPFVIAAMQSSHFAARMCCGTRFAPVQAPMACPVKFPTGFNFTGAVRDAIIGFGAHFARHRHLHGPDGQ